MNARNHAQMHRFIQLAADCRLTPAQQQALDAHLAGCADCRAYAAELEALETQLASVSVTRLVPPKPQATAQQVAAIQTSYRRHTMKKNILSTAAALVTIAVVAVLIILAGRFIPRGTNPAGAPVVTVSSETPTPTNVESRSSSQNDQIIKTSMGEFKYVSARLVDEIPEVKAKADPGFKILRVLLIYLGGEGAQYADPDLFEFYAARPEAGIYILGDNGSHTICTMAGSFGKAEYEIGFMVPDTLTGYQLIWPGNDPISIIPEQIAESTAIPRSQPLLYFTRAEGDALPKQSWQLSPYNETTDPGFDINLTEAEAEQQAGFTVLEPTGLTALEKWNLKGASYDPQLKIVRLFYHSGFVLREERLITNDDCNLCGVVGASAQVDTVQITGDITGEYVVGVWKLTDNGPVWEADPFMKRLRWQANGMAYELMYNPEYDPEAFSQADMLAAAKSITYVDLTQAEAQLGYSVKALASLPTGYVFSRFEVNQPSNSVCLVYEYTGNDGPGPDLWLAQGPAANAPELAALPGFAAARQDPVTVGGAQNAFALSGMQRKGEWACVQPQNGSNPTLRLTWQADGQQFDLYALGGRCMLEEGYSDLDLLRLAEVMTGISTRPTENHEMDVQCERNQIGAMEELAGIKVRYLQGYPGEMEFYGASYSETPTKQIALYYRRQDSNHTGLVISEMSVNPVLGIDLASQYRDLPAEGYQLTTVAGGPAVLILGDWALNDQGEKVWRQEPGMAPTLWFENKGLLIAIGGPWLAEAGGVLQEKLISVAESIAYADLTIAEAESLAGYDVLEPTTHLPASFSLNGASYDPASKLVRYYYSFGQGDFSEYLNISQQPASDGADCDLCGFVVGDSAATWADHSGKIVGANSIETAQIGSITGEYVQGVWTGAHNNGIWSWDPSGPMRLRWKANGMAFELDYLGSMLSYEDLIAIAEGMVATPEDMPDGMKLTGPGSCVDVAGGVIGTGSFIWPSDNHSISGYDYTLKIQHPAIDLAGAVGDPVYASDTGVVIYAGWNDEGYGNVIVIDHGNGWQTLYAHLNAVNVVCGQNVSQGEVIGSIGSTGNIYGTHLHFEIIGVDGKVNPHDYLPAP